MNEHSYQTSNFQFSESAPQHRKESQMSKCLDVCVPEHQSLTLWPQKWWHLSKGLQTSSPLVSSWLSHIFFSLHEAVSQEKIKQAAEFVSLFMPKVEAKAKESSRAFSRARWMKHASNWVAFKTQVMILRLRSVSINIIHISLIFHGDLEFLTEIVDTD